MKDVLLFYKKNMVIKPKPVLNGIIAKLKSIIQSPLQQSPLQHRPSK